MDFSRTRLIALKRDNYSCVVCGAEQSESKQSVHAHHLVPRNAGGRDDPANLVTLCPGCHASHHLNLQIRLARRLIEKWALKLARLIDVRGQIPNTNVSLEAVKRILRIPAFRPGQLEIIFAVLRGDSILLVSPTGSGKSLCFQAPTLLKPGFALVLTPLKALMVDQVRGLHQKKIPATFINSDLSKEEKRQRYQMLRDKSLKFLYCAPERFGGKVSAAERQFLNQLSPKWLVLDEVHVVSKWGRTFRPDYGKVPEIRRSVGNPQVLSFTATAGLETQKRIVEALKIPSLKIFVRDVNRPNIFLVRINNLTEDKKIWWCQRIFDRFRDGKKLIFVPTRKVGEKVAKKFREAGIDIPFFHGRLDGLRRESLQAKFDGRHEPKINVMICTSAFGMGVDIENIRVVVHWQYPASVEDYAQEFGRAGRDGKKSIAVLFTSPNNYGLQEYMINKNLAESELAPTDLKTEREFSIRQLNAMNSYAYHAKGCLRKNLLSFFEDPLQKERKSLAIRLLEFVLCKKTKQAKNSCCSTCNPDYLSEPRGSVAPRNRFATK